MSTEKARLVMSALKKISDTDKTRDINELRIVVALERAIARIECEPVLAKHFVFKGGFVLFKLIDSPRFTRDVDVLAFDLSIKTIPRLMDSALSMNLNDGLWYGDLKNEPLEHQGIYDGIRFSVAFQIGEIPATNKVRKLSRIQIDIGFGDELTEAPKTQLMKSVLPDSQPISWQVYSLESMFAEKLQTLYKRGSANSRARDIYDLVLLYGNCKNRKSLMNAIKKTFETRKTLLPPSLFAEAKKFDLTILESAWPSVELADTSITFKEQWANLLKVLHEIDKSST